MLDGLFSAIGELVFEGLFEGVINLFKRRIEGHPYLTCLYRGTFVAFIFLVGIVIWHLFDDPPFTQTFLPDLILSLQVWLGVTLFLMFITFCKSSK